MPPWKGKVALQHAFSVMPRGHDVNYLFQRHVTHSLPISDELLGLGVQAAQRHVEGVRRHSPIDTATARFFEFGAGWDLHVPQTLFCLGVSRQLVIDLGDYVRPELVAEVGERLRASPSATDFERLPPATTVPFPERLEHLGIEYRAPCDARATGLEAGCIDFITSTSTLEHVPAADVSRILAECSRILHDEGAMSFFVDYRDHYSYFDARLSAYNFLKFDEPTWKRYNPDLQYQNRLRHPDYVALFQDAGFEIDEVETSGSSPDDLQVLADLPVDQGFATYSTEELAIQDARFVVTKHQRSAGPFVTRRRGRTT